jgi:hypothetical protein
MSGAGAAGVERRRWIGSDRSRLAWRSQTTPSTEPRASRQGIAPERRGRKARSKKQNALRLRAGHSPMPLQAARSHHVTVMLTGISMPVMG